MEGGEGVGVGDLRGRLFRVQDAGDAEGEVEVAVLEAGGALRGGGGDGAFVCGVVGGGLGGDLDEGVLMGIDIFESGTCDV